MSGQSFLGAGIPRVGKRTRQLITIELGGTIGTEIENEDIIAIESDGTVPGLATEIKQDIEVGRRNPGRRRDESIGQAVDTNGCGERRRTPSDAFTIDNQTRSGTGHPPILKRRNGAQETKDKRRGGTLFGGAGGCRDLYKDFRMGVYDFAKGKCSRNLSSRELIKLWSGGVVRSPGDRNGRIHTWRRFDFREAAWNREARIPGGDPADFGRRPHSPMCSGALWDGCRTGLASRYSGSLLVRRNLRGRIHDRGGEP